MKLWLILFASAALTISGCSSTSTASRGGGEQQVAAANVSGSDDGSEMICHRIKKTGTRFTQKVCMTREQYERQQEQSAGASHAVREWQRRGKMANDSGGNGI